MKIDLKKSETAFPQLSASKFPFSVVSFFITSFYTFLKYGFLSLSLLAEVSHEEAKMRERRESLYKEPIASASFLSSLSIIHAPACP